MRTSVFRPIGAEEGGSSASRCTVAPHVCLGEVAKCAYRPFGGVMFVRIVRGSHHGSMSLSADNSERSFLAHD